MSDHEYYFPLSLMPRMVLDIDDLLDIDDEDGYPFIIAGDSVMDDGSAFVMLGGSSEVGVTLTALQARQLAELFATVAVEMDQISAGEETVTVGGVVVPLRAASPEDLAQAEVERAREARS